MPLFNRTINPKGQSFLPLQFVKIEEPHLEESESSPLEDLKEVNQGRWTEEENFKFVIFVAYYQEIFVSRHRRKVTKIFKAFAEYLTDRTAAQCRSHYQKMILKFKTPAKLKKHYKSLFGDSAFATEFQRFRREWQQTHPPLSKPTPEIKEFKECQIQTDPMPQAQGCGQCGCKMSENIGHVEADLLQLWQQMQLLQNMNQIFWVQSRLAPTYSLQ